MNIIDSSGWLEYFSDGPNAKHYLRPLSDASSLLVPVITIYEVFKVVLRESSENETIQAAAAMQKGKIVVLTVKIAMEASKLSLRHNLPMADSIILATARAYGGVIWTQDSDFQHFDDVPRRRAKRQANCGINFGCSPKKVGVINTPTA